MLFRSMGRGPGLVEREAEKARALPKGRRHGEPSCGRAQGDSEATRASAEQAGAARAAEVERAEAAARAAEVEAEAEAQKEAGMPENNDGALGAGDEAEADAK